MDGEICLRRAYAAIYQGDFELAIHWFEQAIAIEPENADYYYKGSITCARSGKLTQAMAYAKAAVELKPDEAAYQMNARMIGSKLRIAEARHMLSQPSPELDECLTLLKEAAQHDPLSADARLLLGAIYRLQGKYRESIEALQDVLQLDPQHTEARRLLQEVRSERRTLVKQQYSHYYTKRNR